MEKKVALIVDDDIVNQKLLNTILSDLGYSTVIVDNGEEGVSCYRKKTKLDIILLDMHMPYLNGLDAVRIIRDIEIKENRKHIPVIAVTAFSMEGNKETCISAGCDDYISKPYEREIIIKMVNKYNYLTT